MKKYILAGLLLFLATSASAQAAHTVTLSWTASTDATTNPALTYNMYRLNGACPAAAPAAISGSGFTKQNATPLATTTFTDSSVSPGVYCYFASAFVNSAESIPSNDASAIIQPKSPTSLGVSSVAEMIQVEVPKA